jgi:aminomethyltransferase
MLKRTPLYDTHVRLGGRMVEFGGWGMPVQYTSIVEEHRAVRTAAGVFDISHMGEVRVNGPAAAAFLNAHLTNDVRKLAVGQGQYTLMCNERGGVIDDLYAYRLAEAEFLLIINASRIPDDVSWLTQCLSRFEAKADVSLRNDSDTMGAVAVQGPKVREFIGNVFSGHSDDGTIVSGVADLKKNQIGFWKFLKLAAQPEPKSEVIDAWIACTGYTGEDGFEIIAAAGRIETIWSALAAAGAKPCGLGARDTLRTEMCYPLYGHELNENTTPLEAGLGFFVSLAKGDFVGRTVLAEQKSAGVRRKLVAFTMPEKAAPPRPHYPVWGVGSATAIGEVVSGTQSPSLGIGIGLAYLPVELAEPGGMIEVEIRGRRVPARIVPKPIYRKAV